MNPQKFKQLLEKLERRTPRTAEVLWMVLDRHTDVYIAQCLSIHRGTVRKHIEKIYATFGIKGEFEGDRRSRRGKLAALFAEYKPKEVNDCSSAAANDVTNEGERENQISDLPLVSSSTKGEDLMSLATRMLEQFGFNQKFKVSRAFQHVGYRLKNAEKEVNPHQLILSQRKDGLCISIRKDILDPHLLNLKYWEYTDVLAEADLFTKARFLVLPSKKDIFLESLHPNYWNSLQAEEKTVGDSELNTCTLVELDDYFWEEAQGFAPRPPMCEAVPSLVLDEFNPDTLSDRDTYLVVNDDKLFPGTWQVFIRSREVLEEFLSHFAKMVAN